VVSDGTGRTQPLGDLTRPSGSPVVGPHGAYLNAVAGLCAASRDDVGTARKRIHQALY
jgi:hypothetical protein